MGKVVASIVAVALAFVLCFTVSDVLQVEGIILGAGFVLYLLWG